jgi:undecaprenyl-diphosphatase
VLLQSIDDRAAVWVATHRIAPLSVPSVWLGYVDKVGAVWIVLAVVVGVALRIGLARTLGLALIVAAATFAADSVSFGLKDMVDRTRPFVAHPQIDPLYVVHSSSFPAGHAATAFAGATLLSYVAPKAATSFFVLAILIAYSRVYVGVHYPGDVIAGAIVGAAVGAVAIGVVAFAQRRSDKDGKGACPAAVRRRLEFFLAPSSRR